MTGNCARPTAIVFEELGMSRTLGSWGSYAPAVRQCPLVLVVDPEQIIRMNAADMLAEAGIFAH